MKKVLALVLAVLMIAGLAACGKSGNAKGRDGVWYLGGNNISAGNVDVKSLFEGVEDTIDPAQIYRSLEYTEEMLHGAYTLNNKDKDLKTVRKEIPFEDVAFSNGTASVTILPTAVYMGADNICCSETGYKYSEYQAITDHEVAVLELATADQIGQAPCVYEVNGTSITFKLIDQTSAENEPFEYEFTGIEFTYDFEIAGPHITFTRNNTSLKLTAYCFTENVDRELYMTGYSLFDSPLIADLDYFASAEAWNYAVKRNGSYYDLSAFKLTDEGRFTVYLADKEINGETETFIEQYAYIVQSSSSVFLTDFNIILLDGDKEYYYTDSITQREARVLEEQGADIGNLTEEEIKEIAEKKSDLFDDLYAEFEAQGINVTINRSSGEIVMDSSVLFGGDSAVVTQDGKALLDKFLTAYTSIIYNEKYEGFIAKTLVEGHIAPIAGSTYESGLPLSIQRAENVKEYCLSVNTGENAAKLAATLEAVGLSNSKPVYGANGEVDLDASRRVSFSFIVNINK